MEWTSLTHLIADLRLSAPETEVEGLRREIKQRMHLAHPDHSGGHFATAAQETEYLRLAGALEYLDSLPSSLTTVDGLGTVRAELTEIRTLVTRTLEATRATATTDWRRVSRAEARSEMLVPRLSSAAIGGLALGLLAAGDRLNRVVPGELITSPLFRILLLMLVVGALALWALTWMAEQRFASRCDNLATVDGRQRLLNWVTDWGSTNEFRFSDLTTAIQHAANGQTNAWHARLSPPLQPRLGRRPAELLARSTLDELEASAVVRRISGSFVDQKYTVVNEALEDLLSIRW